jgi:hypothetical protein
VFLGTLEALLALVREKGQSPCADTASDTVITAGFPMSWDRLPVGGTAAESAERSNCGE